jgi:maltose/moltooligosaccharide transporter
MTEALAPPPRKPHLTLLRVVEMNLGFLGLQFSFGLQQGNMVPIYSYLGANEASLPILQLAGPMTGLLIQPLIGALSDRTASRFGRRTPYFLVGALMCSLGLLLMPFSASLLMAASLLWLLDAGNNTTMEPYRAYVSDRLNPDQHEIGFLSQSAFTGLAQSLAFLTPSILVYWFGFDRNAVDAHNIPTITHVSFLIGAVLSISTIAWSVWRVPELPLSDAERATIAAAPRSAAATLAEIWNAIREMPHAMRQMAWMSLFQWYGLSIYWSYAALSIGRSIYHTADKTSAPFRDAVLTTQQLGALYNLIGFAAAFAMVPVARRFGPKQTHLACLTVAGLSLIYLWAIGDGANAAPGLFTMLAMPELGRHLPLILVALGMGLGWASVMGNPYVILAGSIPAQRTGVYMGIFNMMIVIPMLIAGVTFGWLYGHVLGNDPRNAILLAGLLLMAAAVTMVWVKNPAKDARPASA